jgi:hypothetical protein
VSQSETTTVELTAKELARLKKKRFIIPVGLIVLFIIIGVASGGSSSPAGAPALSGSGSVGSASDTKTYKIGDTVRVGEFQYIVNKVSTSTGLGDVADGIGAKPNGIFYVVNVTVKNLDNTASTVDDTLFKLKDGSNEYSASTEGDIYGNQNNNFFLQQLNPNVSLTGNVVFDMPKDAKGFSLDVSGGMTKGGNATIGLGQ